MDFWQTLFRARATEVPSFKYFKPHPILTTAGHSYDINKMIVQLRMLSGRYWVVSLLKHFSSTNTGNCELCGMELEDINHLLIPRCPLLSERTQLLLEYSEAIFSNSIVCANCSKQSWKVKTTFKSSSILIVLFFLWLLKKTNLTKQLYLYCSNSQERGAIVCTEQGWNCNTDGQFKNIKYITIYYSSI